MELLFLKPRGRFFFLMLTYSMSKVDHLNKFICCGEPRINRNELIGTNTIYSLLDVATCPFGLKSWLRLTLTLFRCLMHYQQAFLL